MTVVEPTSLLPGLAARIKGLILRPKAEWAVIEAEPATTAGLLRRYIAILAAIGPVCALIGGLAFGYGVGDIRYRPDPLNALIGAAIAYGLNIGSVFALAAAINALAPSFEGRKDWIMALKAAAYSATPVWVAGLFSLIPALSLLGVLGLYAFYLLWTGLPRLMKTSTGMSGLYFALVVVIGLIFALVIGLVAAPVTRLGMIPGPGESRASGTLRAPGVEVDLGKLDRSAEAAERAAREVQAAIASAGATSPDAEAQARASEALRALMPEALPGYARTEIANSSGGVAGIGSATTRGVYVKDGSRIVLEVVDIGRAGALLSAFNVRSNKETATGYEKVEPVDGRMTSEAYDRQSHIGKYGVLIAGRYMVQASGRPATIAELRQAVEAVSFERLEAMARG